MSKKELSIVIVNYNTGSFLRECVESVEGSDLSGIDWELVVVDNSSSDDSAEQLEEWLAGKREVKKRVKMIRQDDNLGFAAGNNRGLKFTTGEWVLFLNPDTRLPKESLKKAVSFIKEHGDVGAVAINMRMASGEMDEAMHRGFPTPWNAICFFSGLGKVFPRSRWFSGYTLGWKLMDKMPHEIDSGSGAFMLVRREAGEQVRWWDEDYFWNGEDLDFYYRLKKAGWKAMFLPEVRGIHYRGISSGVKKHSQALSGADRERREKVAVASTRAMKIFYEKHYKGEYPKLATTLVMGGIKLMEWVRRVRARWF